MQGLADGYFIVPYTIGGYLSKKLGEKVSTEHDAFSRAESDVTARIDRLLSINGKRTVDQIHKELGKILWEYVGMARNREGLKKALKKIPELREEFWSNVNVPGTANDLNPELEKAGRVADFLELGELMARDALMREESCGGHFREEYQTEENEALRDDEHFAFVSAWEYRDEGQEAKLHKEELVFENVELTTRSYK
jgi:succinate dehydrogenase / fumarate reductase flavoprotein subunit